MSSVPLPKSDDEHLVFLRSLSALKVHFALTWSKNHPGIGFAQALTERTFFLNLGAWHRGQIYDHPECEGRDRQSWRAFLAAAEALSLEPDAERSIMALLPAEEDYFVPRLKRDQAELHSPTVGLAARKGCLWTMGIPGALSLPEDLTAPRTMEFHIANHRYPQSFLKHTDGIAAEWKSMAQRARDLGFEAIGTRSWLNDVPAWLSCFPPEWSERRTPRSTEAVGSHLGCWGQVVTARQTLSSHADHFIREKGVFEFAMRASWMSVDEALRAG